MRVTIKYSVITSGSRIWLGEGCSNLFQILPDFPEFWASGPLSSGNRCGTQPSRLDSLMLICFCSPVFVRDFVIIHPFCSTNQ